MAGKTLDEMIHELLTGSELCRFKGTGAVENREGTVSEFCVNCHQPFGYHRDPPAYSTHIGAAWLLVDFVRSRYPAANAVKLSSTLRGWCCRMRMDYSGRVVSMNAETAELAICRAFLCVQELEQIKAK